MCGICGKISLNGNNPVNEELIKSMADVLNHRGPDDSGVYIFRDGLQLGLGHRRLSIIDLSQAGHQPMCNEDKDIWVVFNGEIYNFRDLRKYLEGKGHIFRSNSDTEAIIHLYEDKGIGCVKELRGMFAFALWDARKQKLFLARDRVGKKPLNYALNNGSLIFASEIKSILQDNRISREIDNEALDLYLTYGYIPAPRTIFQQIKKLPPAHILIWEKGEARFEKYWCLEYKDKIKINENECRQRLMDLLTESTRIRLISDVPLGAFLSGGVDSSVIVALMSSLSSRPIKTFSIGFQEESFNELEYARKIAKLFKTEHREYIVKTDILDVLPKLSWYFNEPFADSSAIPTYYLSKMTRQEVTVALNGDGGDELFAGYERYAANKISGIYGYIPRIIRKNMIRPLLGIFPESTRKKDFIRNIKRFTSVDGFPREKKYAYWMSIFQGSLKSSLYSEDFKYRLGNFDAYDYIYSTYASSDARNFVDRTLFVDTMTYLPGDLLVKADIASMANSLEARSPFLDHKLMEFAATIPASLKLKGITTKYILKKTFSGLLPKEILQRPKQGFAVPVGEWFRSSLKDYACQILLSGRCIRRGYFKEEGIKRILNEHASGKIDHGSRIWSLVNLELWHNIFTDTH